MMKDVGINFEIQVEENAAWNDWMRTGTTDYHISRDASARTIPHEVGTYFLHSDAAQGGASPLYNKAIYTNPEMDRIIDTIPTVLDTVERNKLFADLHRLVLRDIPYLPALQGVRNFKFMSPKVWLGFDHYVYDRGEVRFTLDTAMQK
jgi:ABC-type transport system substrate-binding protein